MRHIESSFMGDFAAVYDDDVEMISVSRSSSAGLEEQAKLTLQRSPDLQCRWIQRSDDATATRSALEKSMSAELLDHFESEIQLATEMLSELLGCDQVGVRMMALEKPMCPRFHVDAVPCRLLTTFTGPVTEWISHGDVDEQAFAERASKAPPLREGAQVRQLGIGDWCLLKGGAWQEGFDGVVHRSPGDTGSRLLVSIDPLFSDA